MFQDDIMKSKTSIDLDNDNFENMIFTDHTRE